MRTKTRVSIKGAPQCGLLTSISCLLSWHISSLGEVEERSCFFCTVASAVDAALPFVVAALSFFLRSTMAFLAAAVRSLAFFLDALVVRSESSTLDWALDWARIVAPH